MPIVSAFATSHAYTFQEPETWDQRREPAKADAVLLIGDDQSENFNSDNLPQLLIYTAEDYVADGGTGEALRELVRRDIPRFRKIIEDIGIQPE